jgi:hypothetical protein
LRWGKEKRKAARREKEKHLARRLVDNIINDYNIEMIDTTNNTKLVYFFCALFFAPSFRSPFSKIFSFFLLHPPTQEDAATSWFATELFPLLVFFWFTILT